MVSTRRGERLACAAERATVLEFKGDALPRPQALGSPTTADNRKSDVAR